MTAHEWIAALNLAPHPEGGYFREIYRSGSRVQPGDGRAIRAALTTIYFLLPAGDASRWHRVASDEVWHYYAGDPLELSMSDDATLGRVTSTRLGPYDSRTEPVRIVPAGTWQSARSTGAYTLAGCTVAPGFEFADFEMVSPAAAR
jgi:predicted cupin superfamily sugar epimerase